VAVVARRLEKGIPTAGEGPPVIAHVVMFRPRPDMSDADRNGLVDALTRALNEIPSIRRARVGTRVTHGRPYEALMHADYEFIALLEFDDLRGLQAYLEHPAHEALGARFFAAFAEALMYDYRLQEGVAGVAALSKSARS
jgi:hypothetical protein